MKVVNKKKAALFLVLFLLISSLVPKNLNDYYLPWPIVS
jgi:hypothetical protein